jgi:Tfp pilus assembly protein PilV
MLAKRLKEEYGYSLVEVMASIVIMVLAILPMMAMFDTGLRSATTGSNYDKSRALANLKLEQAKNMSFDTFRDNFPEPAGTPTTYDGTGRYLSDWKTESGDASADFTNFEYRVEKQYMAQPPTDSLEDPADPSGEVNFLPCPNLVNGCTPPTNLVRVTVTVRWVNDNEYTTYGLVTR